MKNIEKAIFILTLMLLIWVLLVNSFDVYSIAVVGVLYELSWLFAIVLIFLLPLASIVLWGINKFKIKSLFLYSFIVSSGILLFTILVK